MSGLTLVEFMRSRRTQTVYQRGKPIENIMKLKGERRGSLFLRKKEETNPPPFKGASLVSSSAVALPTYEQVPGVQ